MRALGGCWVLGCWGDGEGGGDGANECGGMAEPVDPWTEGVPPLSASPKKSVDLCGTENPYGVSERAARAAGDVLRHCRRDARESLARLREALSRRFNAPSARIVEAAGARALLPGLVRGLASAPARVLVAGPAPPLHRLALHQAAADVVEVPMREGRFPREAWLAALDERPAVALLSQPHNPTGDWLERDALFELVREAGKRGVRVVVDESYADYAADARFGRASTLLDEEPGLVIVRSFSSLHGLALLPAAYALLSDELAPSIRRTLLGLEPGEGAAAAAAAAIEDTSFEQRAADRVRRTRFRLRQSLRELGAEVDEGEGPWVTVHVGDSREWVRRLAARGMRVRDLAGWGWPGRLRVRAGLEEEADALLEAWRAVKKQGVAG